MIPVLVFLLSGCAPPSGAVKHERDISWLGAAEDTLDGLPLVRLKTDPNINLDDYTPSDISVAGRHYRKTEAKHRGASSKRFPKKSMTLEFAKADLLDDERTGFRNVRKVVLVSSFDEVSYVRQALAFELWSRMDPEHLRVHTAFVSVVLNDEYEGVYLMVDHVDDELMERLGLWKGGNLYKGRKSPSNFAVTSREGEPQWPHEGFSKEEGHPPEGEDGAFADLDAFGEWLAQADEEALKNELGAYIDVRDYLDWWILVTLIDAMDTLNKNTHHYRDPRPAEPPNVFRFLPWDFNASFGQDWRTRLMPFDDPLHRYNHSNELFARLTGSAYYRNELQARFSALLSGPLSLDSLRPWLDDAHARVEEAALQDEACWNDLYAEFHESYRGAFTDHAAERAYVDEWIEARWAFVSDELARGTVAQPSEPSPGKHDPAETSSHE